jgi:hypothetical protein
MSLETPTQGEVKRFLDLLPERFAKAEYMGAAKEVWGEAVEAQSGQMKVIAIINKAEAKKLIKRSLVKVPIGTKLNGWISENGKDYVNVYIKVKVNA